MPSTLDAGAINGDTQLSAQQRRAYMAHHRERNSANARLSAIEGVTTLPPVGSCAFNPAWSPARHDVAAFFAWVGDRAAAHFGARPITVVDIGCGGGFVGTLLAERGVRGEYIGVDITRRASWSERDIGGLHARFIEADITRIGADEIPSIDLVVSATALEHIEDDRAAIAHVSSRLSARGAHAHFVPGECALELYGPHGWRQYSPRCLRALFPSGEIFRYGGPGTNRLHAALITRPTSRGMADGRARHPRLYELAMNRAREVDAAAGHAEASMYGVWQSRATF